MRNDKQSEQVLNERAVKNTIQKLCAEGLSDNYDKAAKVLQQFFKLKLTKDVNLVEKN